MLLLVSQMRPIPIFLSLPEQVVRGKSEHGRPESLSSKAPLKAKNTPHPLKELEKKAKAQSTSNISDIKEQNTLKKDIASIKESLSGLGTSVAQDGEMRARVSKLKHSTAVLRDTVDELQGQLGARLRFDYKDPEKGFDRTRVKGMVGKLNSD